jgi:phage baseplate assembly protein gpV
MDQRERLNDPEEALRVAMEGHQADIWTALPGILQSFDAADPGNITATVQPAIQGRLRQTDGSWKDANLPLLLDCPVIFPAGGGFALTFPLAQGDEGLVVFSSRCIDAWWYSGGVQKQARARMHDLSDGFFLPGCFSRARKLANVSATNVQLRSADGQTLVEMAGGGIVNIKAPTQINLNAPIIALTGAIAVDGVVSGQIGGGGTINLGNAALVTTGKITSNGKVLDSHVHGGVQPGGGSTAPPT